MRKTAVQSFAACGVFLMATLLGRGAARGQETSLIVELTDATFVAGAKEGNVVSAVKTITAEQVGTPIPLAGNIALRTRIEPCATVNPPECNGAENFFVEDPETGEITFGCSDMMDNDGDGTSDAMEGDCRGVQGFSFSVVTDPCFGITRATTRGTIADLNVRPPGIRDPEGSFEKTETVDPANNGGLQGAVCAVVFSFTRPIILPQDGEEIVCLLTGGNLDTAGLAPGQMTAPCLLRIMNPEEDGLSGSGEPVKTAVTVAGDTSNPVICNYSFKVAVEEGPPPPPQLSDTAFRVDVVSPAAAAGSKIPDAPGSPNGTIPYIATLQPPFPPAPNPVPVQAAVTVISRLPFCILNPEQCDGDEDFSVVDPETEVVTFGCSDMLDNDADGKTDADDEDCIAIQGFSLSVATDDCFGITRATTRGTIADLNVRPPGIRDPEGSFEKTEVIDPALNGGQRGAVCAVVFSFTKPIFLDQVSENVILLMNGAIDASALTQPGAMTNPCGISVLPPEAEGLRGSGEPVKTAVTVGGNTSNPNQCNATIKLMAAEGPPPPPEGGNFRRCDPNADGKNNIADAVWIVNEIVRSGPEASCQDAGDCNDDGMYDTSDAVYGIMYQFVNGPAPPAPGPSTCGEDPSEDELECPDDQATCPSVP